MTRAPGELIKRLLVSDETAYVELVNTYGEKLLHLAYMVVGDRQLAEDVVQESFLALYAKLQNFRGESSLSTWLTRITLNKAKNKIRPKLFQKIAYFWEINATDTAPLPQDNYEKQEKQSIVREIMLSLPIKYRDVLYLHYFEELKIKEIAEILDVSQSGVKTRLQRGRNQMKDLLKERGLD
ncbi:MAG: hypothetical protein APF76_06715 [Desulfitibacter sp. BRH_c19]|nr:MAG: hypothetical protein APF76_06715 [Desulfitibacter sp. BRH_c19]